MSPVRTAKEEGVLKCAVLSKCQHDPWDAAVSQTTEPRQLARLFNTSPKISLHCLPIAFDSLWF